MTNVLLRRSLCAGLGYVPPPAIPRIAEPEPREHDENHGRQDGVRDHQERAQARAVSADQGISRLGIPGASTQWYRCPISRIGAVLDLDRSLQIEVDRARQARRREVDGRVASIEPAAVEREARPCRDALQPVETGPWRDAEALVVDCANIPTRPLIQVAPRGRVVTYTVISRPKQGDVAVVLAETPAGERFLASSTEPAITAWMQDASPIGREIDARLQDERPVFNFRA